MAHNINFKKQIGMYSFFSINEKAWHGLLQTIDDPLQVRQHSNSLDWIIPKKKKNLHTAQ